MVTQTKSPNFELADPKPTFNADVTIDGTDSLVANEIVVTGRFRDSKELEDWIAAATHQLVNDIDNERGEAVGG